MRDEFGDGDANFLGVDPPLSSDVITIDPVTPNIEQIAAFEPDLILATTAQPAYGQAYDELSAIAPVISYKTALLEDPAEDLVDLIGTALGEQARADALLAESDAAIEAYARAHPELEGVTYAFGQHFAGNTAVVVADDAPSTELLGRLGMRLPDQLAGRLNLLTIDQTSLLLLRALTALEVLTENSPGRFARTPPP
ncbi:MAG: ABC transporter substrate-binding protein [Pseudonocardiaceae bacterium]